MNSVIKIRSCEKKDTEAVKCILKDGSWSNLWASFLTGLRRPTNLALIVAGSAVCYFIWKSVVICIVYIVLHITIIYLLACVGIVYYLYGSPLSDMRDVAANYFQDPDTHFWVAETLRGTVVGTIAIVKMENTNARKIAWLRRMAVDRRYRRLGIAKKLIKTAIDFCRCHGYDSIKLITTEIHRPARILYETLGFMQKDYKPYFYLNGLIKVWTYELEYTIKGEETE